MKPKKIFAADLFCGAGGTSTGLYMAADKLGLRVNLLAVNHWNVAIATHNANHTEAVHLCETLDGVNPRKVIPGGRLNLIVASPECTHHSNARGGRPMSDQSRASAWHVIRWAEALRIDNIIVENVREFMSWGPLGADGRPLKSQRGETFLAWIAAMESLNYRVEHRILNAADYGDPTTRERLFIIARRGRKAIAWPKPTHAKDEKVRKAFNLKPWRAAREIIDWTDHGESIFNRKRPLAPNTIRRIAAGLRKFSGLELEPFLVKLYGTSGAASADKPVPTVTGQGGHLAVAEPYIVNMKGQSDAVDINKPTPTQTTKRHQYLAEPFLLGQQSGATPRSTDEPVPTVSGAGAISKIEPFLTANFGERDEQEPRTHSLEEPTPTVTSRGAGNLIQPFIAEFHGGEGAENRVRDVKDPLPTQTTEPRFGLAQPFMLSAGGPSGSGKPQTVDKPLGTVLGENHRAVVIPVTHSGGKDRSHDVEQPLPTVTGAHRGEFAVVQAFLVQYNGTADAKSVDQPVGALTGKPRYALLITFSSGEQMILDIRFRMLRPRELARAQGFPDDYQFTGKTEDVVKQIGNAVPVNLAQSLCTAVLA